MTQKTLPKNSLGKGLSALLGPEVKSILPTQNNNHNNEELGLVYLAIDQILPNENQPRKKFAESELLELAESIKNIGLLQPIVVRKYGKANFEIIAGERRWHAAQRANLKKVPVIIKDLSDSARFEAALIENIQRQDLSPIEEANGYKQLLDSRNYTQEELAQRMGKSRSHIANSVRLLSLPEEIQELIDEGSISAGHARALLRAKDPINFAKEIVDKKMSVRDVENRIKTLKKNIDSVSKEKDEDILNLEQQLKRILGVGVNINIQGNQGILSFSFYSLEELDELITKFSELEPKENIENK